MLTAGELSLSSHGAKLFAGAAESILGGLFEALALHDKMAAGSRIARNPRVVRLLAGNEGLGSIATQLAGVRAKPVRAILFDKNEQANWTLGWHQDRTICVVRRIDTPDFGPWTTKQGLVHVEPPFDLFRHMTTLRIHLDAVDAGNSPHLISPGSHLRGRISERDVSSIVDECGQFACLADAGDVWAYATPILHASERSVTAKRRRVLQVDYCSDDLPNGLEWLGV